MTTSSAASSSSRGRPTVGMGSRPLRLPQPLLLLLALGSTLGAFVGHQPGAPLHVRRQTRMVEAAAVAENPPASAPRRPSPRSPGRHQQQQRSPRGPAFVLDNPMYLQRKKPVIQQQQQQAPERRSSPRGGGAPGGGGDVLEPSAGFDGSRDAPGARRFNKKPDKGGKGAGSDRRDGGEMRGGPKGGRGKGGGQRRRGRGGFHDDSYEETQALKRAPRKKGKVGKAGPAAPAAPVGPAQVSLGDAITVAELATQLRVSAADVIKSLMKVGVLASLTQSIDAATAEKLALSYGAEVARANDGADDDLATNTLGVIEEEEDVDALVKRPPVVTIMGHVDHGKTSLLDAMRTTNVAADEAGGITQAIGAYSVVVPGSEGGESVTFIDTPGHAAFDEMRSRGANVTDIVILAVAADDGVMPQTVQSIRAAKAANVPIIVALTKADKPEADAAKVRLQLLEHEVVLEEFGGDVLATEVSAKTGDGLGDLFGQIGLQADILDLKANPDRLAAGTVIEARQVQGQGAVATVLVQRGTLRVGDIVVAGAQWGRVRSLVSDAGKRLTDAPPSAAVELVGLAGLPEAGDSVTVTGDDNKARELAETRQRLQRERRSSALFASRSTEQQQFFLAGLQGDLPTKLLDFVVKADVQGAAEALSSSLEEMEAADDKLRVKTRVLRSGAGAITNEDIMLASVSSATVIGFNSAASQQQRDMAEKQGVTILEYDIVYDALDAVAAEMASLIRPPPSKQLGSLVGTLDVQAIFKIGAIGKVAGCKVRDGFVRVGSNIRILRGNLIVYEGKLQSLRSNQDAVDQVDAPAECGLSFDDYQGMEADDRVEVYAARDAAIDDVDDA